MRARLVLFASVGFVSVFSSSFVFLLIWLAGVYIELTKCAGGGGEMLSMQESFENIHRNIYRRRNSFRQQNAWLNG